MGIAYYNGAFTSYGDVKISPTDRSIFFGDGIYEALVGRKGKIYLLIEHLDRFYKNVQRLSLPFDKSPDELTEILYELVKKEESEVYMIYFQLTRYSEERVHAYPEEKRYNLFAYTKPVSLEREKELRVITKEDIRYGMCDIKTLNLLPNVLASREAAVQGCDECVFLRRGVVTECAHSNLFIVKDGTLYTHPTDSHILPGITRAKMIDIAGGLGIECHEALFGMRELLEADEILITSTTKLCKRVSEIDSIKMKNEKISIGNALISALWEDFLQQTEQIC